MAYLKISWALSLVVLCCTNVVYSGTEDFYWLEYNGTIPNEAFVGGHDAIGQTYIGVTFFPAHTAVIPTIIYRNNRAASSFLGPFDLKSEINTQILCAAPNNQPTWVKIGEMDKANETGCDFIKAGYFEGANLHIGRANINGQIITGKVFPPGHKWAKLEVWVEKQIDIPKNFEMLGYCNKDSNTIGGSTNTDEQEAIKVDELCVYTPC